MHLEKSTLGATLLLGVLANVAVFGTAWSDPGAVLTCKKINHFTMDALGAPLNDGDEFGDAVATLGDLDGSGPAVGALAVGAISDDEGGTHRGSVYVLFLDSSGDVLSYRKISSLEPDLVGAIESDDEFGGALAYLGDLDGPGPSVAALAVGAIGDDDDNGFDRGAVYILFLDRTGRVLSHQKISDSEGNFLAPLDDLDEFGGAMTHLGDLDGTGPSVAAMAVGAIGDDDGGTNRGATYILFLSASGNVISYQKINDSEGDFNVTLGDNDNFGEDVAGLGDLDGSGPSVAALAATAVDDDDGGTDRGAVYILFLAQTGKVLSYQKISNTEGNFSGPLADKDNFGSSVIGLGDLDGSGPSAMALAVGAASDDGDGLDRGAVYILFLNSAGAVLSDREISSTGEPFGCTLNEEAEFGGSLAALGDLDGSGPAGQFLISGVGLDDDGGTDRGGVYVLILAGNGGSGAAEIAVEQPAGTNISDGGSKGFGSVNVGGNADLIFTIKNTGTGDLTGLGISINGTDAAQFSVTASPTAPVAAGGSTTFTVRFAPSSGGAKSAALHIANNDSNENPFDINLTGTGVSLAPEIVVEQPVGTNISDGGSKGFGSVNVGSNADLIFTIKNTGMGDLTGLGISINGTDAAQFSVTASPTAPVAAGGNTTFTVRFAPSSGGAKSAALHIANNDSNENPFDINLTGTGVTVVPEIAVEQPAGTNISDGGSKGFGSVDVGGNADLIFTIKNTGTGDLTGLGISINGTDAAQFSVTASPTAPVAAGGSTTFTVRFAPSSGGAKSAALHIANNDSNENPFDINLTGTGVTVVPEIAVEQPAGTNISDGGSKGFGSVDVGGNADLIFTIKNTGTGDLTGLGISIDGTDAALFSVTASPTAPVAASGSTTFTVRFAPSSGGAKSAALHIANNDSNENPFDINLTGTGVTLEPEIAVEQPAGTNISDGGSKDFGSVDVSGNADLIFTIKNTGTANLTGLGISIDGTDAAQFSVTASPTAPVAESGSTTFTLRFAPSSGGAKSAALHIANNDSDENPFDINLNAMGTIPLAVSDWVAEFALEGARPNPVVGHGFNVTFSLPMSASARLELLDMSGRRLLEREVGSLGVGRHTVNLAEGKRVAPGLYWVRLVQGEQRRVSRVAVLQ